MELAFAIRAATFVVILALDIGEILGGGGGD